jgi:hypothetical protein
MVRKLKASGTGEYVVSQGIGDPQPNILGNPVLTDPNAPVPAANAYTIAFGDFSKYVAIRDAGGLRVERSDDYAFANDLVTFRDLTHRLEGADQWKQLGGQVAPNQECWPSRLSMIGRLGRGSNVGEPNHDRVVGVVPLQSASRLDHPDRAGGRCRSIHPGAGLRAPFADGVSDLLILPVVRSWDGNLMVDPFGNLPETAVDAWS